MSLPTVVQPNSSQQYRNEQYPTAVQVNNLIQTQEPIDRNCFLSNTTFSNTGTTLVSCTPSKPLHIPPTPENPISNYQTAIVPPIDQQDSQPKVSGNSNQFPIWLCHVSHQFQPRTEIQTEGIPFEHNFNLQTTNKSSIKLPPVTIPNFNGNPLKYHERINNFFNLVHHNIRLTDTHRIIPSKLARRKSQRKNSSLFV